MPQKYGYEDMMNPNLKRYIPSEKKAYVYLLSFNLIAR